jgi:predicted esterase
MPIAYQYCGGLKWADTKQEHSKDNNTRRESEIIFYYCTFPNFHCIFGGFSAGANVAAAAKIIHSGQGNHVLALVCDSGLKYLSTDLYPQ